MYSALRCAFDGRNESIMRFLQHESYRCCPRMQAYRTRSDGAANNVEPWSSVDGQRNYIQLVGCLQVHHALCCFVDMNTTTATATGGMLLV
jgi:hypothetical protein